jgi:hypothetical protein
MKYNIWLDDNKFTYDLIDNSVVNSWIEFMQDTDVSFLRTNLDPWHGTLNIDDKIAAFNSIIEKINLWIPFKIDLFDSKNPEASLNRLHIHFPRQEKVEQDTARQEELRIFNDLLHQIDLGIKSKGQRVFLLVCPDQEKSREFYNNEYSLFQPNWEFGDLMLHYPHVGRHPFEIFTTNDLDVPPDQIICQHKISTLHTLRFFDAKVSKEKFKIFYKSSGIAWPYESEDPRLSFGYIKLGNLESINNNKLSRHEILNIVKSGKKITDWQFDQNSN